MKYDRLTFQNQVYVGMQFWSASDDHRTNKTIYEFLGYDRKCRSADGAKCEGCKGEIRTRRIWPTGRDFSFCGTSDGTTKNMNIKWEHVQILEDELFEI